MTLAKEGPEALAGAVRANDREIAERVELEITAPSPVAQARHVVVKLDSGRPYVDASVVAANG